MDFTEQNLITFFEIAYKVVHKMYLFFYTVTHIRLRIETLLHTGRLNDMEFRQQR